MMKSSVWSYRFHKYKRLLAALVWATITTIPLFVRHLTGKKIVAIVLAEQFGDIMAAEPLGRGIRQEHPNAFLIWVVRRPFAQLTETYSFLDQSLVLDNTLQRLFLLKTLFFAKVYNLHLSDQHHPDLFQRHLNPAAEAQKLNVFNYLKAGNLLTVFSKIVGIRPVDDFPKLQIPPQIKAEIDALHLPKIYIVVHCHSNYAPKDWQNQHWERLIMALIKRDYHVLEIGLNSSLNIQHTHYQNLCGQLSLLASAEVISRAAFFVGIDSGPAHFANALNVFGFILLGKLNDFEQYNVYSGNYTSTERACLIQNQNGTCAALSYEQVWKAIEKVV